LTLEFKTLPHQREFIKETDNVILVGGYRAGKSQAGTYKTILKKLQNPTYSVAYYLPTYGLIRDIAFDKFPTVLDELGLRHTLNKTDKEIHIQNYGSIIFRSMENPETIVGYEVAYSLIDEADVLPMEKMDKVYKKILARNSVTQKPHVDAVSTPEGFKWLYKMANSGHFKVIRAKTQNNKFISDGYVQELKAQYPENLLLAYLEGEFVNLTTGTIYRYFKRDTHNSNKIHNGTEQIYIGQDFNTGGCVSIVYVKRNDDMHAVDEYESYDTRGIINNTKAKYPSCSITFYPDASGNAKKTSASTTDIQMLREAGFQVLVNPRNPAVKDRHNITNNRFEKNKLFINTTKCPKLTNAFEQHAYATNGEPEKFTGAGTIDDYTDAGTYPVAYMYPIEVRKSDIISQPIPINNPLAKANNGRR